MQTWDEYYTKTLTLGVISGPVEGVLTLCAVFAYTAVKGGGSFWQQSFLATIGVGRHSFIPNTLYEWSWGEWYMVYGSIVLVFATGSRYVYVFHSRRCGMQQRSIMGRKSRCIRPTFDGLDPETSISSNFFHDLRIHPQDCRLSHRSITTELTFW